ncbi:AAA family ATPase [Hymenobacter sp. J193]|uniref:ParA family protein n=1 Tax=Hymenobacter sp. J193 TaxID=2898429 RepID=UPI002150E5A8|nr:AAA family ATPase [Hymenobacter sp. J193]MCR5890342.1 AAA family ATPase [Hymenobacter sp. J193]
MSQETHVCRVIAITNNKGGVCKTTTTVALGAQLAELGHRVLLIDLDPQANLTKHLIGKEPGALEAIELHIGDVLSGSTTLADAVLAYSSTNPDLMDKTLHFVPASYIMEQYEKGLSKKPEMPQLLRKAIRPLRPHYDYVLLDCPPQMSLFTYLALAAADYFLVTSLAATFSYDGIKNIFEAVEDVRDSVNPNLQFAGVGIMRYNPKIRHKPHENAVNKIEQLVTEQFGRDKVLGYVREDRMVEAAQEEGRIIHDVATLSRVKDDYYALTTKLVEAVR